MPIGFLHIRHRRKAIMNAVWLRFGRIFFRSTRVIQLFSFTCLVNTINLIGTCIEIVSRLDRFIYFSNIILQQTISRYLNVHYICIKWLFPVWSECYAEVYLPIYVCVCVCYKIPWVVKRLNTTTTSILYRYLFCCHD